MVEETMINRVAEEVVLVFLRRIVYCNVNANDDISLIFIACSVKSLEQNEQKGSKKMANAIIGFKLEAKLGG